MRWVDGFVERHGDTTADVGAEAVLLQAADTATVRLEVPWPPFSPPPTRDPSFVAGVLARHALRPRTVGLLLVRRGGFALGTARDGELLVHKTGTRYVQSRTAAGGWSQQRYARRRGNQADALVEAVVDAVAQRLDARELDGLVPGGDGSLVDAVLADPRLRALAALPRGPLLAVADPRLDVLTEAATRTLAVRIQLTQP
ncbi:acVLRF1 family peptidyl-tRNA hydrolase [Angustibacter aerolatus]